MFMALTLSSHSPMVSATNSVQGVCMTSVLGQLWTGAFSGGPAPDALNDPLSLGNAILLVSTTNISGSQTYISTLPFLPSSSTNLLRLPNGSSEDPSGIQILLMFSSLCDP